MEAEIMRLQKYLSQAGICSRRKAEEYIQNGQVFVNGQKASLGQSVNPKLDTITLWENATLSQQEYVYYVYNKPRGIETTCAQRWGKSIIDIIDIPERVFPVGRLDKDSTGLILLTNDGRMTNYLTHPRYGHEKEYIVETFGAISDGQILQMSQGVEVLWKLTLPCHIERVAAGKFSIILTEWRNRQIRRMVESVGSKVKKLKRIRIENIHLWNLEEAMYRKLTKQEKNELFSFLGIE